MPERVATGVDTHVPVYALAPYNGAHRQVILAAKERRNLAVRRHMGAVLGAAVAYLQAGGFIGHDAVLVPTPTRVSSARSRGGDPVAQMCRLSGVATRECLRMGEKAADQSELSAAGRRENVQGAIRLMQAPPTMPIVLVDDVVTTGATLAGSAERLIAAGASVQAAVVIAAA